jgi:hypothetical protein
MAVYRVDVLTDNPDSVVEWKQRHMQPGQMVRFIGYRTVRGWYFKCVFKRQEDASAFHREFYPEIDDHYVSAHGVRETTLAEDNRDGES